MPHIEVYWGPGCTSCMRVKEFLTKHNIEFEAVNIVGSKENIERMRGHGFDMAPVVCSDNVCVSGVDIPAVAKLVGITDYVPHEILPTDRLYETMTYVVGKLIGYVRQMPFDALAHSSPDRNRPFRDLSLHVLDAPWAFVMGYETGKESWGYQEMKDAKQPMMTGPQLAEYGEMVLAKLVNWWEESGKDDDTMADRVIETYWGWQTLHEAMERETWHSAQHTRQIMMYLNQLGIEPEGGYLDMARLEGLPLPDHVWSD